MTETMGTPSGGASDTSTRDVAKDEARGVAQDAVHGGKQTVETAKQQAGEVASEAVNHARALLDQARGEITGQGSAQKERATSGLRSLAEELTGLVEGNASAGGTVSGLARQASDTARNAADWLETREPGDVLDEVRRFARQRPGTFLLGAAALGLVGGRLTRSLAAEAHDDSSGAYAGSASRGYTTGTPAVQPGLGASGGTGLGTGLGAGVGTATGTGVPVTADFPDEAPGTPGYAIPPTASDTRGDATAEFAPNAPGTGLGETSTDQMPSEFGARGTNASGNRTEEGLR